MQYRLLHSEEGLCFYRQCLSGHFQSQDVIQCVELSSLEFICTSDSMLENKQESAFKVAPSEDAPSFSNWPEEFSAHARHARLLEPFSKCLKAANHILTRSQCRRAVFEHVRRERVQKGPLFHSAALKALDNTNAGVF